jgi:hypothetical protein
MANRWVKFVKEWSASNNESYMCAATKPEVREAYRTKYGLAKKVSQKKERESMAAEDINVKPPPVPRKKPSLESKERFSMSAEDILSKKTIQYPVQPRITKKKTGRKPIYATEAEKKKAKREQTLASNRKRYYEKKGEKK